MEKHYRKMIQDTQERVARALRSQVLDSKSPRYGGFADSTGIVQAKYAIYQVTTMAAAYCNEDSVYYHQERLLDSILLGLDYVRRVQHENGLFDYITCNFLSAPDTAFCVKRLLPVYLYLAEKAGALKLSGASSDTNAAAGNAAGAGRKAALPALGSAQEGSLAPGEWEIYRRMDVIVRSAAGGMLSGGFHTPNHRWAIASVLMACGRLFGDGRMTAEASRYLIEGIDCNEDGEYAERSAGNYNRVNNDAMILLTAATGDPAYEQHVIRNLRMMLTYWEPDGSVFTANSTRFDKDRLMYPTDYYMEYLEMGMKYNIPEFLRMCNYIFEIVDREHLEGPDCLIRLMLVPAYRSLECEGSFVREDFRKFYRESGIARGQQGCFTYTVMGGKSDFLHIHNGSMKLTVKVAGSFCEHRAFRSEKMEQISEHEYYLTQTMQGWYYLPFEEKPESSDWWKMDNASRKKKFGPNMRIEAWVREVENGVDVRVKTSGVEGAPWRIELAFSGVNFMTSEYMDMPLSGSEVVVMKQGCAEVGNGTDALTAGPCFGAHHFTEGKEDSEAKTPGAATLYLTDYTAFDHTIEIRRR